MEKEHFKIIMKGECRSKLNNKIVRLNNYKIGEIKGIVKTMCRIYGGYSIGAIGYLPDKNCWMLDVWCTKDTYDKITKMIKDINDDVFPDLCEFEE